MELKQRIPLIKAHPFFQALCEADLIELAQSAIETRYLPEQTIFNEGDVIDTIYLVAFGDIEVDVDNIPRTILHPGEAIGLTQTGFYSHSGLRTATLIALTEALVIGWPIETLNGFIKRHPEYHEAMQVSAEKMLRANFIKQAAPFSDLPGSAVMELAEKIEEISVAAGTVLFQQGDSATECYLITSGEIEISIIDKDAPRIIDTIGRGRLFGESAILGNPKRNATARASTSAQLLVLTAEQLNGLVHHPHTAQALMGLVVEHWHPRQTEGIAYFHRTSDEGVAVTILKNKRLGRYYQLSEEGWAIWQQLDGQKNLQEIAIGLFRERQVFAPQAVADMILNLAEAGFVILPELREQTTAIKEEVLTPWQKVRRKLREWRYLHWISDDIDPALTKAYNRGFFALFTWPGQILLGALALSGSILFGLSLIHLERQDISLSTIMLICLCVFVANLLSTIFHELAHGFTVKHHKHEVHRAGIVFAWLGLAAFVDTSDMWLSPRGPRIAVSLAGPYTDIILAGGCSILAFAMPTSPLSLFFLLLALMLYYSVIKNLNPLIDNDGHAALKDALNARNLLAGPKTKFFWLACGTIFFLSVLIAALGQHVLRSFLPENVFGVSTMHLLWILPALVMGNFARLIYRAVRHI